MPREVSRAIVVMGRVPSPGRVKTRLTPLVSPELAARFYEAFLRDVLERAAAAGSELGAAVRFSVALAEGETLAAAAGLLPPGVEPVAQGGGELGARIESARASGAAGHVLVLGSDAPTMDGARYAEAFEALDAGCDAVFGPVEDGGYDLVGFAGPQPELLREIPWSTEAVMAATRARAAAAGLRVHELALGYDVDRPEDLARALRDAGRPERRARHTEAALRRWLPQVCLDSADGVD
jgi:rSAM/selenodomain-associated transferase 1